MKISLSFNCYFMDISEKKEKRKCHREIKSWSPMMFPTTLSYRLRLAAFERLDEMRFWVNGFFTLYWELTNPGRVVWLCHWLHRWERRSCRVSLEAEGKTKCQNSHDQPWSHPSGFAVHPKDHSTSTLTHSYLSFGYIYLVYLSYIACSMYVHMCEVACGGQRGTLVDSSTVLQLIFHVKISH